MVTIKSFMFTASFQGISWLGSVFMR